MDKSNKEKIILSLCSGTGAWEKPYAQAGYNIISITLPGQDVRLYEPPDNIYGILAAPPCTMFSLARTRAKKERCFYEGMETVRACLDIIWECRSKIKYKKDGALKFWCIENPMGFLRQFLGMPYHIFDPCDYGDRYTKKTDLWGYFNIPKKKQTQLNNEELKRCKINNRKLPYIQNIPGGKHQSARRSITPPGFAKAFFLSNQ